MQVKAWLKITHIVLNNSHSKSSHQAYEGPSTTLISICFLCRCFWKSWNERMSFRNVPVTFLCSVIEENARFWCWMRGRGFRETLIPLVTCRGSWIPADIRYSVFWYSSRCGDMSLFTQSRHGDLLRCGDQKSGPQKGKPYKWIEELFWRCWAEFQRWPITHVCVSVKLVLSCAPQTFMTGTAFAFPHTHSPYMVSPAHFLILIRNDIISNMKIWVLN